MAITKDRLTQLSTSVLPLEDLAEYLRVGRLFLAENDSAFDVKNVGGINSSEIAVAVSPEQRDTVRNAQQLGGVPHYEYLTNEKGGQIEHKYVDIRGAFSNEMRELRDELYQLKGSLARAGLITNYNDYLGFHETFNEKDPLYLSDPIVDVERTDINTIYTKADTIDNVSEHDYVVIKRKGYNEDAIVAYVTEVDKANNLFKYNSDKSLPGIAAEDLEVTKVLGAYYNNSFAFVNKTGNIPSSNVNHSTLDDDQFKRYYKVNAVNSGFAYTFKLGTQAFSGEEEKTYGYLCDLKLHGSLSSYDNIDKAVNLTAYVVKEADREKFKNPKQATEDELVIAKSKPLNIKNIKDKHFFNFNFMQSDSTYPVLESYDYLGNSVRYCLFVEVTCDNENAFNNGEEYIMFTLLYNGDSSASDLQTKNAFYEYSQVATDERGLSTQISSDNAANELYYSFATREMLEDTIQPFMQGLYTKHLTLDEFLEVSRARLTLRIKREGLFQVHKDQLASVSDGGEISLIKQPEADGEYDLSTIGGIGLSPMFPSKTVIGGVIRNATATSVNNCIPEKGLYLENTMEDVYRVGYTVRLRARKKVLTGSASGPFYDIVDEEDIELPLVAVRSDRVKGNPAQSDRLLFEGAFRKYETVTDETKDIDPIDIAEDDKDSVARRFNDFELQVYWNSGYTTNVLTDEKNKKYLHGAITDLTLSFDTSI